jgi:hypothetical protein
VAIPPRDLVTHRDQIRFKMPDLYEPVMVISRGGFAFFGFLF